MKLHEVPTPALLLDLDVLEANLERMSRRVRALGVRLRPHVKTHKCLEVARRQQSRGADGITVSTLEEARTFVEGGFDDVTWAFPVIPGREEEVAELADRATLRLVVDGPEAVEALEATGRRLHAWIKVDCGYGRAGVSPGGERLLELARRLSSSRELVFDGLLTHEGQSYDARGQDQLATAAEEARQTMLSAAERIRASGVDVPAISMGSTPGMAGARTLEGVDEVRPGNYAFYDRTQVVLGSCHVADCALTVLASVVSSQPSAEHCVVDAGALSLSVDPGPDDGRETMGEIFDDYDDRRLRSDARLVSLSQEHGIVSGRLPHGHRVRILPNHSCLTAACFDSYHVVRDRQVVDRWRIERKR